MFADREEAARLLLEKLQEYKGKNPLILAIPRGAVPMAKTIANELDGEVDVVLVHKLGAPGNPEYAIGSISETGEVYVSEDGEKVATPDYIEMERASQLKTLKKRREMYTPVRPPIDPSGRIVIVVDDGIATGSTMIAALQSIRNRNPKKLICAVPVGASDSVKRVEKEADETICLDTPRFFMAVGQFYSHFSQVEDEEVIEIFKGE